MGYKVHVLLVRVAIGYNHVLLLFRVRIWLFSLFDHVRHEMDFWLAGVVGDVL